MMRKTPGKKSKRSRASSGKPRRNKRLTGAFFEQDVCKAARELIGATLLVNGIGGIIVETEAYRHEDPAAHGYGGKTQRNAAMFGPAGRAYVYRSYGIHWCLNFVCSGEGIADAILIRAIEPVRGLAKMRKRRRVSGERMLCSGPGKLCEALGVTREHDGLALSRPPFKLFARKTKPALLAGKRIGITKAADRPWRYGMKGSRFLSRPF